MYVSWYSFYLKCRFVNRIFNEMKVQVATLCRIIAVMRFVAEQWFLFPFDEHEEQQRASIFEERVWEIRLMQ
jgi:hypothetical protein